MCSLFKNRIPIISCILVTTLFDVYYARLGYVCFIPCARKGQILFCKKNHSDSTKKFSETDIINMLKFVIDNIHVFVIFGGRVFQQTVGIPMGTSCAPLLADLFLYSYEADFIQGLLKKNENDPFNSRSPI